MATVCVVQGARADLEVMSRASPGIGNEPDDEEGGNDGSTDDMFLRTACQLR